jgi:hypothetical protein
VVLRLRVLLAAERHRALDQQRLLAHVDPRERQRFSGPQAGVGEDREEGGVACRDGGAHPFDGQWSERPDLLAWSLTIASEKASSADPL